VTGLLALVGGAPHPIVNLYYVPITYAAAAFGWRGAIAAAVPTGFLAGPLGPVLFDVSPPTDSTWLVRVVMYVAIGLFIAALSGQAKHPLMSTVRDAVAARRLRRAMDRGAVEAHVQPIVDLASGRVVGAEALCRWRAIDNTLIPPASFIPMAERTGVILDLGRLMLQQATVQCAQWSAQGFDHLVVNVNVSAVQLSDRAFLGDVSAALNESGLRPEQLCLEITESAIIRNPATELATVSAAHAMGIRIALDDFGIGQSSLAYLQEFPIDVIKIDRSFVSGVDKDPKCSTLVLAIIQMSHALGATCIAEGIERPSQQSSLQVLGCDLGQGYHLGRPGPPPEHGEGWLARAARSEILALDEPCAYDRPTSQPATPRPRKGGP